MTNKPKPKWWGCDCLVDYLDIMDSRVEVFAGTVEARLVCPNCGSEFQTEAVSIESLIKFPGHIMEDDNETLT